MSNRSNIELSNIADRYAIALIELAERSGMLDVFESDLSVINATINSNKDLFMFLTHPVIPLTDKKDIIDSIFKNSVSSYVLNLLKLLLDRNRLFVFSSIVSHYNDILNKKRNLVIAKVITAIEIDESIKNRLKSRLEEFLNSSIKLDLKIDPDIIAGMVVKVNGKVIDGSIRTKLENMKRQLI